MTPVHEAKKSAVLSWLVPALLAIITALMALGGGTVIDNMRDTRADMQGLRKDFQESAVMTEKRLTHLEDTLSIYTEGASDKLMVAERNQKKDMELDSNSPHERTHGMAERTETKH